MKIKGKHNFETRPQLNGVNLVDTNDSRLSDPRTPTAHATTHTNGTDDIRDATASLKGLATATQITKLDGIAAGAEVNVNADWNSSSGDSQILNKPTLGTAAAKNIPATGDASITEVVYGTDTRLTNPRTPTAHAASHASAGGDAITISESQVTNLITDLGNKVTANVAITAATNTKITYDAKGLVTSGTSATTADIADSSNKRYVTDSNLTVLGNTSGTNSGDVTLATNSGLSFGSGQTLLTVGTPSSITTSSTNSVTTNTHTHAITGFATGSGSASGTNTGDETTTTAGALINSATTKATPVDADMLGLMDSAASNLLKKLSWLNVKATLKTYFDTLYNSIFGAGYSSSLVTANVGTSSATYASANLLTTGTLAAGNYVVNVWLIGSNATGVDSATTTPGMFRIRVDGTVLGPANIRMPITAHQRGNAYAFVLDSSASFSYPITLTNAVHTVNLDTATNGGTFNCATSFIELWRVS